MPARHRGLTWRVILVAALCAIAATRVWAEGSALSLRLLGLAPQGGYALKIEQACAVKAGDALQVTRGDEVLGVAPVVDGPSADGVVRIIPRFTAALLTSDRYTLVKVTELSPPVQTADRSTPPQATDRAVPTQVPPPEDPGDRVILDGITIEQLESVLRQEGYTFERINGNVVGWKIDGVKALLAVEGTVLSFQISYGDVHPSYEKLNLWNRNHMLSQTYLDKSGDPVLELDLNLRGGITLARLKSFLQGCRFSIPKWLDEVIK